MKIIKNMCRDCITPCTEECKLKNIPVHYCDNDINEYAEYRIDGEELCEKCATEYLQDEFNSLSIYERAETLGIHCEEI